MTSAQSDKIPPPVVVSQAFCPECGMPASMDGYRMCDHIDVEDKGVEIVEYVQRAERDKLAEALEIAYDALVRTTRDTAFGYEEKKATEDYVRRVLKECGRG